MEITLTSIRLRHWWGYFPLTYNAMKIMFQLKQEKGFIQMKNTGRGYLHFTMSAWETPEDRARFSRQGAHAKAMQLSARLSNEITVHSYQAEQLPHWPKAKKLLQEKGSRIKF